MTIVKYSVLFGWSLVLVTMIIVIIRSHSFIRRKKEGDWNISEATYIVALLVAATLAVIPVLQVLVADFDILQKFYPDKLPSMLIRSGSLLSLAGMALFILSCVAARGLSTILFFGRKPLVEFDANNIPYSLVRAGLLVCLSMLLTPLFSPLFQYLLPAITTPFYR